MVLRLLAGGSYLEIIEQLLFIGRKDDASLLVWSEQDSSVVLLLQNCWLYRVIRKKPQGLCSLT